MGLARASPRSHLPIFPSLTGHAAAPETKAAAAAAALCRAADIIDRATQPRVSAFRGPSHRVSAAQKLVNDAAHAAARETGAAISACCAKYTAAVISALSDGAAIPTIDSDDYALLREYDHTRSSAILLRFRVAPPSKEDLAKWTSSRASAAAGGGGSR